jgi:short-subunit dehydrogenase
VGDMLRIFITGASSGLGLELARRYATDGVRLGLVARRRELLEDHLPALAARGADCRIYVQDVADLAGMRRAIDDFLAFAGGADLVLANAGVGIRSGLLEGNAEEVAWLMGVNVIGVTNTVVPFVPAMVRQGSGVLAAVGSVAGFRGLPGRTAYSASKGAVRQFMDGLRMDLHGTGVHAMTLCPGFVETPFTAHNPSMFFVMRVEEAVDAMVRAVDRRARVSTFPWQMRLLRPVLGLAPEALVRKLAPKSRTESSR